MVPLPGLVLRVGLANDVEPAPTPNEAACGTQLPYRAPHFHPVLSLFSLRSRHEAARSFVLVVGWIDENEKFCPKFVGQTADDDFRINPSAQHAVERHDVMTLDFLLQPLPQGVESALPWGEIRLIRSNQPLSLSRADSTGLGQRTPGSPVRESASRDGSSVALESLVEISSGGSVFFCHFADTQTTVEDKVVVLKFVSDRLLCQSEMFASEIARYLDINGPQCRIVMPDSDEWAELKARCYELRQQQQEHEQDGTESTDRTESILHCLEKQHSLLVLEYIPGPPLLTSEEAIEDVESIAYALGQVLALDMILGNPDRLCVKRLGWPGNPHNILFGRGGRHDKRVVCIDAVVQRKPPQVLTSLEDASCEELAELAFNDVGFVREVLEDALFDNSQLRGGGVTVESAELMQRGMVATWKKAGDLRGIFEMMLRNIDEWIEEFVDDMDNESMSHVLPVGNSALSPRTRRSLSRTSLCVVVDVAGISLTMLSRFVCSRKQTTG